MVRERNGNMLISMVSTHNYLITENDPKELNDLGKDPKYSERGTIV